MPWSITRITSVCSFTRARKRSSLSASERVASRTITAARRSLRRPRCAIAKRRKLTKIPKPSSRSRAPVSLADSVASVIRMSSRRRWPSTESVVARETTSCGLVAPNTSVAVTKLVPRVPTSEMLKPCRRPTRSSTSDASTSGFMRVAVQPWNSSFASWAPDNAARISGRVPPVASPVPWKMFVRRSSSESRVASTAAGSTPNAPLDDSPLTLSPLDSTYA